MQDISWDEFRRKNKNPQQAFEDLGYFLFAREFGQSNGIFGYKNQTGIEKDPIYINGKWRAFQSKFFENTFSWKVLQKNIKSAKIKNPKLNFYRIYSNIDPSESSGTGVKKSKGHIDTEKLASDLGIELDFVLASKLFQILNKPSNIDLAIFYFGVGDELSFIKNNVDHKVQTFLQSKEYIPLPLTKEGKSIKNVTSSILRTKQKSFLVVGHPGSGKSVLTHSIFKDIAGLNKRTEEELKEHLIKNDAVPMIINLKNCLSTSLESIVRNRQGDSEIRGQKLKFIYILDGLDELSEDRADLILSQVRELENQEDTKKIIISCRSGNLNRVKAKDYIEEIVEFEFCDLAETHIYQFFEAKGDDKKIKSLEKIKKTKSKLLKNVRDILLIRLLWETIEDLEEKSTVTDLIQKRIDLLLKNPNHKKNIDSLNLLDDKCEKIIEINQDISFQFQQKFHYRFSQKELQQIISQKFERLDYKSINTIINYLRDLFFDSNYQDDDPTPGYIYQHRRYQDFFFAQRLKYEYEKDPNILRELDILSNRDFFEEYFLPYVRKDYELKENIVGFADLNLIDVYLGNHRGFGVDDAYYLSSDEFIPALACQNENRINELLESENFKIKDVLFVDIEKLRNDFIKWEKDKSAFRVTDHLVNRWSGGIGSLMRHSVIFWKSGNQTLAKKLLKNLSEVENIYKKYDFFDEAQTKANQTFEEPYSRNLYEWLFISIVIKKNAPRQIFLKFVQPNLKRLENNEDFSMRDKSRERLLQSFFSASLWEKPEATFTLIKDLDSVETNILLDVLSSFTFLPLLIKNKELQKKLKLKLEELEVAVSEENLHLYFLKKLLGVELSKTEKASLKEMLLKLRNERKMEWHWRKVPKTFALISYILDTNNFEQALEIEDSYFRFYDELEFYSALFRSLIEILEEKRSFVSVIRDYLKYVEGRDQELGQYLRVEISFILAEIFSAGESKTEITHIKALIRRTVQQGRGVLPYSFFYHLSNINKKLFDKITNESDLVALERNSEDADSYQDLVNSYFAMSIFFSSIDQIKSKNYFVRGLKEGILRHGWRKDPLVSYYLVEALEILWKNNWLPKDEAVKVAEEVFDLGIKVGNLTDDAGDGPYNLINFISKYDTDFAVKLKNKLDSREKYPYYNNKVTTPIILGKILTGVPIEKIEEEMRAYRSDYDYKNKPTADSYEQKMRVYVALSCSDLYTKNEKKDSFEKAFALVEQMKQDEVSSYLSDVYFRDLKSQYIALCKKYGKKPNVYLEKERYPIKKRGVISESEALAEIKKLDTKQKVRGFYKKISNYKNGYQLSKIETWQTLLEKTYDIIGNIRPFVILLERFSFPHYDRSSELSKFLHLGLAAALDNIKTKQEVIIFLRTETGHGGFLNMMKTYEVIGDKQKCIDLFYRYLKICHLLSD